MQGGDDLSIEELAANLSTYKDQLREVHSAIPALGNFNDPFVQSLNISGFDGS